MALAVVLIVGNEHRVHMGVVTNQSLRYYFVKHCQLQLMQLLETLVSLDGTEKSVLNVGSISSLDLSLTPSYLCTRLSKYDATFC